MRLLRYYKHRFCTFISIMKESLIARRVKGPAKKQTSSNVAMVGDDEEQKIGGFNNKVFSLNPSQ